LLRLWNRNRRKEENALTSLIAASTVKFIQSPLSLNLFSNASKTKKGERYFLSIDFMAAF
jgi:hypothetical protein